AADPSKYELHVKINRLTQRLINKTTEVVEKEQMIHKKDLCFFELRALLERRLDPNLTAEMSLAKATIRKQRKQMQALTAEINMNIYDLEKKALNAIRNNKNWIKAKLKLLNNKENISSNLQKKPLPPIAVKSMSCTGSKLRVFKPTFPLLQMFN
ncbi:cilia- and flagella-associated protein 58 isoform X2, partial [Biomphalaria glabrata]